MNLKSAVYAACVVVSVAGQASAAGYLEFRTGFASNSDGSTETLGLALGYDHSFEGGNFIGGELVVDTDSSLSGSVGGVNFRFGVPITETSNVFVTVGRIWQEYTATSFSLYPVPGITTSYGMQYDTVAGIGYRSDLSKNSYLSLQYQHGFDFDFDRAMVGVGFRL